MSAKHMLREVYWQAADVSLGGDCLVDPPTPSLVGSGLEICVEGPWPAALLLMLKADPALTWLLYVSFSSPENQHPQLCYSIYDTDKNKQ